MIFTVTYCCWLSLTVSLSTMDLLYVSHSLPWLLAVSYYLYNNIELMAVSHCLPWMMAFFHCLSCPMEFLDVSHCLLWLLAVSNCLSQFHGVPDNLSLSPNVAG